MAYLEKIRQRGVTFDSNWPGGVKPKQEESRPWKQNGGQSRDGFKNNRNGKSKSVGPQNGNRDGGRR